MLPKQMVGSLFSAIYTCILFCRAFFQMLPFFTLNRFYCCDRLNEWSQYRIWLKFKERLLNILYPQKIFCGGILESACRLIGWAVGWSGGQACVRSVCLSAKILYIQLLQLQPDSLDTWQDTIFSHVSLVIAELWPMEL